MTEIFNAQDINALRYALVDALLYCRENRSSVEVLLKSRPDDPEILRMYDFWTDSICSYQKLQRAFYSLKSDSLIGEVFTND